ncbi:aspartate aminotransferase family protein [Celerinatantimonas diazotrophica]|uniref:Taurine--2-oxoglutarate transaminase n=1 Tax=Celerinatantimonas diazotrophica TaxID=412034 RepID=A0A4R1K230_9GAMM|nr:aspartate aminotransferase family protein [Celerinatantimonas diazotrophica]TCK57733.1 taurine--2-oxoglutarate transaminase [Celerinatantimonas diazotrophica]CAG9298205.1 Taurine--pyruvate aminotransferase [Celerinatantimonas diazotrophica]
MSIHKGVKVTNEQVYQLDREYVFHSWSTQGQLNPMVIAGAKGCKLWDYQGHEYLDFSSQLVNVNIGYQHPKVVEAIRAQASELVTIAPAMANRARGEAAKRIIAHAPKGFKKVFFANAGADSNENAIRMARVFTGRSKILSGYRSYHGNTGSAIVATGDPRRIPNEYATGHVHFFQPYLYRSEFHSETEEQECERALAHLRRVIELEGPEAIAGLLLETIPGTAGILMPPAGYLKGVQEICNEFGIVMILDEVMAGFGRTGEWFALDGFDVTPDLITFAKGVNAGYVPAGGVIISEKISDFFNDHYFPGGLTYSGHPLAMAAIVATIDAMEEEKVVENAAMIGQEVIAPQLADLQKKHAMIGEVRGKGVFWAVELVGDPDKQTPLDADTMVAIKAGLIDKGMLPFVAGNRIHIVPPCVVTAEEVHLGMDYIDQVLTKYAI